MTALHKKGNTDDPSNYRPISVLPVVVKLCERVVCIQLMTSLVDHNVLCPQQYGFRPGLSTEAALLDAVIFATENMDNGSVTSLVTADTSKVFDSVEHDRLLDKLGWYGVHREWFAAWLSGRSQVVRGGSVSLDVSHGVVQGSILGAVLFLLFTNDLPQHIPSGKTVMYADDTQFLDAHCPSNIQELKIRIENSLAVALQWFTQNRLKINPTKTEFVIIKSRRLKVETVPTFWKRSDTTIRQRQGDGCLTLTWDSHISRIVQRCYCILAGLARLRHKIPGNVGTKRLPVEA